jgi:1-acyl-sn-glycerol-3-phosphate acyltransferase
VSSNASDVPGPGKRAKGREKAAAAERAERAERAAKADVKLPEQVYKDERPAEYFARYHERSRDHEPEWIYEFVRVITTLLAVTVFRARAYGSENVPNGPVIIAPNHGSFMDHFLCGAFIRRHVQFMAKSHMFTHGSLKTWIYTHGGVFPVRRGSRDEESFTTATTILRRGGCLGMYVEGGRTRTGELSDEAKPGMGRLALETGAAIVPVAIIGSHRIRNWKRFEFPRITVHYGAPLSFTPVQDPSRGMQQAASDEVLRRIRTLYEQNLDSKKAG